jgi:hypothetical protein
VREFTDYELMRDWLADVEREADEDGYRADVYVLWHDHPPGQEGCACVQDPFAYRTFTTKRQRDRS